MINLLLKTHTSFLYKNSCRKNTHIINVNKHESTQKLFYFSDKDDQEKVTDKTETFESGKTY